MQEEVPSTLTSAREFVALNFQEIRRITVKIKQVEKS